MNKAQGKDSCRFSWERHMIPLNRKPQGHSKTIVGLLVGIDVLPVVVVEVVVAAADQRPTR